MRSPRVLGGTAASCLIVLSTASAFAQSNRAAVGGAVEDAYAEHVTYTYAQVLRVVPVFRETQVTQLREDCAAVDLGSSAQSEHLPSSVGGAGAVSGAALLQTGFAATAPAPRQLLPDEVDDAPTGCSMVDEAVTVTRQDGFDVEYRYRGEVFVSRLDFDPGDRLRIRVAVVPAVEMATRSGDWQVANPSH